MFSLARPSELEYIFRAQSSGTQILQPRTRVHGLALPIPGHGNAFQVIISMSLHLHICKIEIRVAMSSLT